MGEGGGEGSGLGGQGGCDRRIEKFLGKLKKKIQGGGGRYGGVRVDMNEELKFLCKFNFFFFFFFLGGGGSGERSGGEGSGWGGQGGCESRIEVFWKIQKKIGGWRLGPWGVWGRVGGSGRM